ncbi:MAG TPA: hypothetical protein VJB11_03820 [archaeon]|nr:hypothetical protein [archaeon]
MPCLKCFGRFVIANGRCRDAWKCKNGLLYNDYKNNFTDKCQEKENHKLFKRIIKKRRYKGKEMPCCDGLGNRYKTCGCLLK